ncbi:DUF192 domain-containing protein [Rubellicoccus peritrichatus]|uniref:DUF192 domain-containing protein n=1 Tax=Rubellicoccus peritrichatus TaxID=3080537 RepID=A0AAQ3LB69_9BACT|nr:DUF192 domain-containing protein [Puniceicoccus sp. CR14]WOO42620.1 DUF192 domain-containing protein [Puniceicoccus sp. CR14]
MNSFVLRLLLLGSLIFVFAGCGDKAATAKPESVTVEPASAWFPVTVGDQSIKVQLALTDDEKQRGLMHRTGLAENEGMLFLFETPRKQSFWMKNTPTPLSIGYFTQDGVLREIYKMYPHDFTAVESRRTDIPFCLEMNQGWFADKKVRPGSQLNLDELRAAIKARGFEPVQFGL